jgi:hypothetical protein
MAGTAFTPSSPAEVAAAANALLGDLDEVLWAAKTPEELVEAVAACEALRAHLAAVEASALAEVEHRRVARQRLGWSSTGDWFTHLAGLHHGPGRAAVRHATLLAGDRSRTREALRDGLISPEHALKGAIDWTSLTDDGTELSPAAVRRLACDADVIPVALGSRGEVLDVGRTHRLVTPALWRALVCRDRHCAFPGCTRPPVMGHAHHLGPWADGGTTTPTNLVLLCGHHHRVIHHTAWQVRLNPHDQRPEFRPPPRPGRHHPPPDWIRHRTRRE